MIFDILLIASFAALNHIRGGWLEIPGDRIVASLGMGLAYLVYTDVPLAGAVVALGMYIWALKGWGLYFAAGHGQWSRKETEVAWIDKIGLRLFPFITSTPHVSNVRRGIFCMGLRGWAYSLPLFAGLSYVFDLKALFVWNLFFLQGVAYYVARKFTGNFVWLAEVIWGCFIGLILTYLGGQYG